MLVNCYETPYILLISRGKTAKKMPMFLVLFAFFGGKKFTLKNEWKM